MSGSRRVQRSVRVTIAAGLLGAAAVFVAVTVVTSTLVRVAAVGSVLLGVVAARIIFSEVVQTRREASRDRAKQARDFRETITRSHADHLAYSATMTGRLSQRDQRIGELDATVRLAELRADDAEGRVRREARRANEAQERLAAVLDEVLGTTEYDVDADRAAAARPATSPGPAAVAEVADLPTIVDLLGWDEKAKASRADAAMAAELTTASAPAPAQRRRA